MTGRMLLRERGGVGWRRRLVILFIQNVTRLTFMTDLFLALCRNSPNNPSVIEIMGHFITSLLHGLGATLIVDSQASTALLCANLSGMELLPHFLLHTGETHYTLRASRGATRGMPDEPGQSELLESSWSPNAWSRSHRVASGLCGTRGWRGCRWGSCRSCCWWPAMWSERTLQDDDTTRRSRPKNRWYTVATEGRRRWWCGKAR